MYGGSPGGHDSGNMSGKEPIQTFGQFANIISGKSPMGKGSKTPAAPKPTPAMEGAQAQNWLQQQQYDREQKSAADERTRQENAKAAQRTQTAADVANQYGQGQAYGSQKMGSLGFADTYGIMDRYNQQLNAAKSNVPGEATNVGSYFNPSSYWDTAINEATTGQRNKLNTEFSNFTKPGWQQGQYGFADTADDAILNAIMGEQRQGTQDTLKGNLARGTMSQGAYDYALNQMKNQETAGMSNLQNIGGGVLGKYREGLGNTANQYGDRVTGYQLGQDVNLADLQGQLTGQRGGYEQGMQGDIRNALGDTKLFDLEKLISSAGVATGAGNTPLANAFNQQQTALVDPNRTTGTTGIF